MNHGVGEDTAFNLGNYLEASVITQMDKDFKKCNSNEKKKKKGMDA